MQALEGVWFTHMQAYWTKLSRLAPSAYAAAEELIVKRMEATQADKQSQLSQFRLIPEAKNMMSSLLGAAPNDVLVIVDATVSAVNSDVLRACLVVAGARGAVIIVLPGNSSMEDRATLTAAQHSVACLVQEGIAVQVNCLLQWTAGRHGWCIGLFGHNDLDKALAMQSPLITRLLTTGALTSGLISKLADMNTAERARAHPESPTNRHAAMPQQRGQAFWSTLLSSLGVFCNGRMGDCVQARVTVVELDPGVGEVLSMIAEKTDFEGQDLANMPLLWAGISEKMTPSRKRTVEQVLESLNRNVADRRKKRRLSREGSVTEDRLLELEKPFTAMAEAVSLVLDR